MKQIHQLHIKPAPISRWHIEKTGSRILMAGEDR